jgi:hypothetical protein
MHQQQQGTKGRVEVKLRSAPLEGTTEGEGEGDGIKGIEMWNKWKLGKGLVRAFALELMRSIN